MKAIRDWLYPKRIEIHQSFESISHEKKRFVNQGLRLSLQLFSEFKAANQQDYDLSINLQSGFVSQILSLPTINRYLLPMLTKTPKSEAQKGDLKIDFKLLFSSYYFDKVSAEESKSTAMGELMVETSKDERQMFIFANTFELLHCHLVRCMDAFQMYPVLQCLEVTVGHLSRSIFDMQRSSIDEYIMTLLLRNQLRSILEFETTSKLFGTIFGERVSLKT